MRSSGLMGSAAKTPRPSEDQRKRRSPNKANSSRPQKLSYEQHAGGELPPPDQQILSLDGKLASETGMQVREMNLEGHTMRSKMPSCMLSPSRGISTSPSSAGPPLPASSSPQRGITAAEVFRNQRAKEMPPATSHGLARLDPAAASGRARPSPFGLVETISTGLLPSVISDGIGRSPHAKSPVAIKQQEHEALAAATKAQVWLRRVASESSVKLQPRRLVADDLISTLHERLMQIPALQPDLSDDQRAVARLAEYDQVIDVELVPRVGRYQPPLHTWPLHEYPLHTWP